MRSVFATFWGPSQCRRFLNSIFLDPQSFGPLIQPVNGRTPIFVFCSNLGLCELCSNLPTIGEICSCLHFFLCGKKLSIPGEKFISLRSNSMRSSSAPATTSCFAASVARRRPTLLARYLFTDLKCSRFQVTVPKPSQRAPGARGCPSQRPPGRPAQGSRAGP